MVDGIENLMLILFRRVLVGEKKKTTSYTFH